MNRELEEIDKQLKVLKWKKINNTIILVVGVFATLSIFLAIIGVPFILGATYGLFSANKKINALLLRKAELRDRK